MQATAVLTGLAVTARKSQRLRDEHLDMASSGLRAVSEPAVRPVYRLRSVTRVIADNLEMSFINYSRRAHFILVWTTYCPAHSLKVNRRSREFIGFLPVYFSVLERG